MSFILSPNMQLSIPTVGQEPSPEYAFDVNSSLTLIDQHDHSPGRGIQVTPAGLNINSTLNIQNQNLTNINNLVFQSQVTSTQFQALYVSPGSESPPIGDLWYNDSNGTPVQITANGQVNATAAAIPGESYAAGTFFWKQTQSGFPTTPANFDIGSIMLRPNIAGTTNGVTLSPPSSIASSYSLQLPFVPASTSFLTIDNSGNILSTQVYPLTNAGIADGTIQNSKFATGTQVPIPSNTTTVSYTVLPTDGLVRASNGPINVTLYSAAANPGLTIKIKKVDNNFNVITVLPFGGETIDGLSSIKLATYQECYTLESDGTNWQIVNHKCDTNWVFYTPTFGGFGTTTVVGFVWRRVGDSIQIQGYFTTGTNTGTFASFSLPSGLNIDATKFGRGNTTAQNGMAVGNWAITTGQSSGNILTATATSTTDLYFSGAYGGGSVQLAQPGSFFSNGQSMGESCTSVPIVNWMA